MDPSNIKTSVKHINPPQQYEMKPNLNVLQNNKEDEIMDPVTYSTILHNAEKHPKKYTDNFCDCNCNCNNDCFLFGIFNIILCNSRIDLSHEYSNNCCIGCCNLCSVFNCSKCDCGGCDCGGCDCGGCDCGGCGF
jgi:hypothetical protein